MRVEQEAQAVLFERVRSEFLEMPGLRLVPQQAARLWDVDASLSVRLLDGLVETGFLHRARDGASLRADVP